MLKVEGLTVRYGEKTVVDGVNFRVEAGQWWMLAGPNGAGKSTLVNAIAQGVPYQGKILLQGTDARALRPGELARRVGVLAQMNLAGYAFTVEEVARLGRYAHRKGLFHLDDKTGDAWVENALELTGLTALRAHSILTLSGGELQRVFLAQVLAQNPALMILDEPANHLDIPYQKQLFTLIGAWLRQPGRAVISVVHDLSLAKQYGTHGLLLHEGRAVAQGEIGGVLNPAHLSAVYGMDVYAWMRGMLSRWQEDAQEETPPAQLSNQ